MIQDKEKLTKLYEFLKQYNDVKNPIILDIDNQKWSKKLDNIPKHESIENNIYNTEETDTILSVKKPQLTNCLKPPKTIEEWIEGDWINPRKKITYKKFIVVNNPDYDITDENSEKYITINFEEDKDRIESFENWNNQREIWAKRETIARDCDDLYNEMFSLYSDLKKDGESVELVFGDGNLYFNNSKYKYINHPILLQSMKLEFDANIPEFSLVIGDKEPELYKSIFNIFTDANHEILRDIYKEFDMDNISPNDLAQSKSFLTRISNAISSKGKFVEDIKDIDKQCEYPQIYIKPILFLRKRNLGFGVAIDSIIEDLTIDYNVPAFLEDIVGIERKKQSSSDTTNNPKDNTINPNGIDKHILLTKPANTEQLTVAKQLERNGAVLVQGPPGTGKTHTIANMVGHLLSQGKSILVTSYSEKALSVLKEKVTENLQSLCLSLLSTTESRTEMEKTLDKINENRSSLEVGTLKVKISQLESTRSEYITKLNNLKLELKNARMSEYTPIVIGGQEYNPIDASKFIKNYKEEASWIPSPIKLGELPSLTNLEIKELYASNTAITKEEEIEYDCILPDISELITPIDFSNLIDNKNKFIEEKLQENLDIWKSSKKEISIEKLKHILNDIVKALETIDTNSEWNIAIIEDSEEEVLKNNWITLINEINNVYQLSLSISDDMIRYDPQLLDNDSNDVEKELDIIINRLESGGKLNKFYLLVNSNIKKLINNSRVNGKIPTSIEEFKALKKYYNLQQTRQSLRNRWDRQIAILGAEQSEKLGENLEIICKKYCDVIERNINWYKNEWNPIIKVVSDYGIDVSMINNKVDLSTDKYSKIKFIKQDLGTKLIDALNSQIYRMEYKQYKEKQNSLELTINKYASNQSNIIKLLQSAIINEDKLIYQGSYESIKAIKEISSSIQRRRELLRKLELTAPTWANEIRNRRGDFGKSTVNKNIDEAWKYRQFIDILDKRNSVSIESIQQEISNLENILRTNTSELAFNKAWLYKLLQFEDNRSQIQAIEGWRQLIRKIGAGKGKKAESLKAEARKLMPQCQSAVPVWIMPINKVVENFNPKQNKFDVVIIDEASQADMMALVALYLGKQAIIVGDNEQVSPLAIGEKSEDIKRLSKEYLNTYNIPNHFLYSGKFSIYDLAQSSGYQPIRLKEHFRCVPDIIEYSNILSYNGQIKPLRDASNLTIDKPIITYKVENAITINKTNEKEANAIVSLILSCCEQQEYKDMTFGVITLRGEKQADLINKMLQSKMSPVEYGKRNILCGNPANFQGDERDVIFLSMVDSNDKETPMRLSGYGTDNLYKKRYNVAMSRARDQVWLVHSVDSENDLKVGDIRKNLLDYCQNYKSRKVELEKNILKADSEFEKRVMKYLIEKGYKVVPQWEVGSYRIDMLVMDKDNKIALECDGERWHGEDKLESDMNRQSILERLGWRFIRIRGSEFFRDEEATMNKVYEKLDAVDIYPSNSYSEVSIDDENSLKDKVIIRAQEIRNEWNENKV